MKTSRSNRNGLVGVAALLASVPVAVQAQLSPREIASLARDSVVTITGYVDGEEYAFGSGFIVEPDGLVATNLHVVMGVDSVSIELEGGDTFDDVFILNYDEERDIVLLKVEADALPALAIGDDRTMEVGDPVYVMGNPLGLSGTFSDGLLSAKRTEDGTDTLQITAPISEGSSGGPVLNEFGEAIGIATSFYVDGQNLNMAMPARYVRIMALEAGAPVPFAESPVPELGKTGFGKLGEYVWDWPEIMTTLPDDVRRDLETKEAWEQQVAARNKVASDAMVAAGWQSWGEVDWNYIATGDWSTIETFLPAGRYTVFSICDDDCTDIDIAVFDSSEEMVAEDTEVDAFPLVEFTVSKAGNYMIDTSMYDCVTNACLFRTTVWAEQGATTDLDAYPADVQLALAIIDQQIDASDELRWLRRIEQDYPIVRQQFVALVAESAGRDEAMTNIYSWSASIGSTYLPRYLAQASDAAVLEFAENYLDVLEQLMQQKGAICYAWMFGDVSDAKSVETLSRLGGDDLNRVMGRVIDSVGTELIDPLSEDAALAFLEVVFADMEERVDGDIVEDLLLLDETSPSPRDQRRICEITHALYTSTLALPASARADMLRYLLAAD